MSIPKPNPTIHRQNPQNKKSSHENHTSTLSLRRSRLNSIVLLKGKWKIESAAHVQECTECNDFTHHKIPVTLQKYETTDRIDRWRPWRIKLIDMCVFFLILCFNFYFFVIFLYSILFWCQNCDDIWWSLWDSMVILILIYYLPFYCYSGCAIYFLRVYYAILYR